MVEQSVKFSTAVNYLSQTRTEVRIR